MSNKNYLNQVLKCLSKQGFLLERIPLDKISSALIKMESKNILTSLHLRETEENIKLISDNLVLYKINETAESLPYYTEIISNDDSFLFILLFEDETVTFKPDYLYSNSNQLQLEIWVSLGVSEKDKLEKTDKYLDYLNHKKLLELYYKKNMSFEDYKNSQ